MERVKQYRVPLIATLGVLVLALVVYMAWISPEGSKLTSLKNRESQQASLESELIGLEHEKQNITATCAKLATDISEIPATPQVDNFLNQVTNLAVQSGDPNTPSISVTSAAGSVKGTTGVTPVAVSLSLGGTYDQMAQFLSGLYTFPRLFTINGANLAGGSAAVGGTSQYTLNLGGDIYFSASQQDACHTA
jgi:Tfp pilus assembly protein PilO